MRILCVCEGGFTRSVCLAGHLRNRNGTPCHDALAIAWRFNSPETLEMMSRWAEMIVVMEPYMVEKIPAAWREKVTICDVGPDRYGQSLHPELVQQIREWSRKEGLQE